jgi:hypothetical protein
MMLLIEIHVETIENAETPSSTQEKRGDERPIRVRQKQNTISNRLWNAVKMSIPGSLKRRNITRDE